MFLHTVVIRLLNSRGRSFEPPKPTSDHQSLFPNVAKECFTFPTYLPLETTSGGSLSRGYIALACSHHFHGQDRSVCTQVQTNPLRVQRSKCKLGKESTSKFTYIQQYSTVNVQCCIIRGKEVVDSVQVHCCHDVKKDTDTLSM